MAVRLLIVPSRRTMWLAHPIERSTRGVVTVAGRSWVREDDPDAAPLARHDVRLRAAHIHEVIGGLVAQVHLGEEEATPHDYSIP